MVKAPEALHLPRATRLAPDASLPLPAFVELASGLIKVFKNLVYHRIWLEGEPPIRHADPEPAELLSKLLCRVPVQVDSEQGSGDRVAAIVRGLDAPG